MADPQDEQFVEKRTNDQDLWQFFRDSPLVGLDLVFERKKDISREVELDK